MIAAYAAGLGEPEVEAGELAPVGDPAGELPGADREARIAFVLCLDAIDFGFGWWPTISKRPGHSGFFTVGAGLGDRFRRHGPWPAPEVTRLTAAEVATVLGQTPGIR